jgi:large subunit ribosomal protein L6
MSRIGKKPIVLPKGVTATLNSGVLEISGPKGKLEQAVHKDVVVTIAEGEIVVSVPKPDVKAQRALWGLFRSLVSNMVTGVTTGYEIKLEVNGVGFKVVLAGKQLTLNLGFSHPIVVNVPADLEVEVDKNTIVVKGISKQVVGQFAANLRALKKPEPYKGKGIKYIDEIILRKAGKVVKAVGK